MANSNQILWNQHVAFVQHLKREEHKKYYAVYDEKQLLCATLNVEFVDKKNCERGIISAPHLHGTGRTGEIEIVFYQMLREQGVEWIWAKVLKNNLRSIRYHLKMGFGEYNRDENYIYLRHKL